MYFVMAIHEVISAQGLSFYLAQGVPLAGISQRGRAVCLLFVVNGCCLLVVCCLWLCVFVCLCLCVRLCSLVSSYEEMGL